MYPFVICCGTKSKPGFENGTPLLKFGASFVRAKPLVLPSVPGKESPPAPLDQLASFAPAVKSYATLPLGTELVTLISTHQSRLALIPMPNNVPEAFLNFQ